MGANALGQSCKQRLVHCKQVHIPCQSVRRTFSLGLPLGHKYTHSKGVFVQTLSSLVYFWGDEKMIKAMWPDSRNDLLTVSGVNYCTHTARTPSFTKTNVRARQMQAHAQGFNLINSSNIWKQNSLVGAFFCFFFSTLVSVHHVPPQIPQHVWDVEINLRWGCCRDPLVSSIPCLQSIFLRIFLHFQLLIMSPLAHVTQKHTFLKR